MLSVVIAWSSCDNNTIFCVFSCFVDYGLTYHACSCEILHLSAVSAADTICIVCHLLTVDYSICCHEG